MAGRRLYGNERQVFIIGQRCSYLRLSTGLARADLAAFELTVTSAVRNDNPAARRNAPGPEGLARPGATAS